MLKSFIFCLILLPCLSFSQTTVLIKRDFQENTFEEKNRKFAKEYFDNFCTKIETKLKTNIATDKTLGIIFDEKNTATTFLISFYMGDEEKDLGIMPYLKISIVDNFNKHEINWWKYPHSEYETTNFKDRLEKHVAILDDDFKYNTLHVIFGNFCSYNQPDLSLQKTHMKKYKNVIILPFKKDSKFQIIHNIATNSLISNNYNEYQSARDHLGIFVLPSNSQRDKEDFAVSLSIKEEKDSLVVKATFFGKDVNLVTPIEVKTTVKIDKARFYRGDYTEATYMIGTIFDGFHINNFMLVK